MQHETIAMKTAAAAQYAGGGTAVYFGLSAGEWQAIGVVAGIVIGLAGLAVNYYFKHKHYKLAVMRAGVGDDDPS